MIPIYIVAIPPVVLVLVDDPLDQAVHFSRLLHVRQVPRLLDCVDGEARRERFGMRGRDDPVLAAPNHLNGCCEGRDAGGQGAPLPALAQPPPRTPPQLPPTPPP